MADKSDSVRDWTWRATKVLALGKDGINMASVSNPLPVDAVVSVDSMSLKAEMSEASGHDYYVATSATGDGTDTVSFDSISGLSLKDLVKVENKTQGWIYNLKGSTVGNTSIELDMTIQEDSAPVPDTTDEFEVVYRGDSRLTDKSQMVNITDGSNEVNIVNNGDTWEPGTTDLNGFGVYGYDSVNNIAKPLKLTSNGILNSYDTYASQQLNEKNLDAVTSATNGTSVDVSDYKNKTIYVNVSVNTGAVTVNIEVSPDDTTWWSYDAKIYTAVTAKDSWEITSHHPYMRITTTSHSNATVTAFITGRGE